MGHASTDESAIGAEFLAQAREHLTNAHELLRHCANQLNDEQIWWRPRDSQNGIGNLLLHITGNLHERIVSVVGEEPIRRNRSQEFAERGPIARDELLRQLGQVVTRCDVIFANLTPARLLERRSYQGLKHRFDRDVLSVILHTLLHLAGHAQEVVFMTRSLLGEEYEFLNPVTP